MRGIPVEASVTNGHASEGMQLRNHLEAGRLYVQDRGFVDYRLLAHMLDKHASFIARLKTNTAFTVSEERTVSPEAKAAGIIRDCLISRLGTDHHKQEIHQALRIIDIRSGDSIVRLVTDRLEMPAELIALAYRYRWTVELFFRWLKCILDCRHWLGESLKALTIQVYAALIASVLMVLWTNKKPTKATFEMLCFYFSGWASEEELQRHIDRLPQQALHPA